MRLTPDDIALIRTTQPAFVEKADSLATLFYDTLFAANPALRSMFPHDMQDQGRKLMTTLAVAIDALENWDRLAPLLANLARRHLGYGVEPYHYAAVARAFHATLETMGVNVQTRDAWQRAMSALTSYMIEVAYPDRAAAHTNVA